MASKRKASYTEASDIAQGETIPVEEIGNHDGIQPVAENDFNKQIETETFMNQLLTIVVADSPFKNSQKVVTPTVNGVNQPIIRGVKTKIKRKYVEALARCRETNYDQVVPDPNRPHVMYMKPRTVMKDPFTVYEDPHPNGREWLQAILNEKE